MTESDRHLTEDDRNTLADGSMPADRAKELEAHLQCCAACAADVANIRNLMARARDVSIPSTPPLNELWPSIRSRIDQAKVVPLATSIVAARARVLPRWAVGTASVAVFAVLLAKWPRPVHEAPARNATTDSTTAVFAVADSVRSYEHEAQTLLNELELRRALLRPETTASIDRDLKVIDQAIGELELAIANDPRNPALRQLLASSYRQKVDVLKRATNAG